MIHIPRGTSSTSSMSTVPLWQAKVEQRSIAYLGHPSVINLPRQSSVSVIRSPQTLSPGILYERPESVTVVPPGTLSFFENGEGTPDATAATSVEDMALSVPSFPIPDGATLNVRYRSHRRLSCEQQRRTMH